MPQDRLLVFNSHEAWVHQLEGLGTPLDIVIGLPGRHSAGWDEQMRPVPRSARLLTLNEAAHSGEPYQAVIVHSVTDLIDAKVFDVPKLVILHTTLEGRVAEEGSKIDPKEMGTLLRQLLKLVGGYAVSVSELKGKSWGITQDYVPFAVDPEAYLPATLELAVGLRISNLFNKRRKILLGDLHEAAFDRLPIRIVGHNPDIAGATAAASWDELKALLSAHRFYVHTAHPELEDGYNMATLEAMAAGLPVLGNRHPSSPIESGVSGYLSDDPSELRDFAESLLSDRELALRMGRAARERVTERFPMTRFLSGIRRSLERARQRFSARR